MIETIIFDYLNDTMQVPAYMEEPERPPAEYLRIELLGASITDHVKSAVIGVQSYGSSLFRAASISHEAVGKMLDSIALNQISKCKLNSEYNFSDEKTHRYRYQAVFDIVYF